MDDLFFQLNFSVLGLVRVTITKKTTEIYMPRKFTLALVIGLLGTALAVGSVLATGPSVSKSKGHGLHARVAELLNIKESELINAFEVAKQEIDEEKRLEKLDGLVSKGLLTEDQVSEIIAWEDKRPEDLNWIKGRMATNDGLAKLVELGKIDEGEASAFSEWLEDKPVKAYEDISKGIPNGSIKKKHGFSKSHDKWMKDELRSKWEDAGREKKRTD